MRRVLVLEAIIEPPGGCVLLQIALTLRNQQLDPESLVWSCATRGNMATIRLTLRPSNACFASPLSAELRAIPEVVHVDLCDLTERSPPPTITPQIQATD